MLSILYLKSNHKNSLQKTNKYQLIDAKLTSGDQVWFFAVVATDVATTYSEWSLSRKYHDNSKKQHSSSMEIAPKRVSCISVI